MTNVAPARLRDAFARAGYTQEALVGCCYTSTTISAPVLCRRTRAGSTGARHPRPPLLAGERLPRPAVAAALDVDAAVVAGLLEGEAELVAAFAVDEWHGFCVAHDHEGDAAFDHVAGISNASRTLAALTLRPARRALDLGTGCGSGRCLYHGTRSMSSRGLDGACAPGGPPEPRAELGHRRRVAEGGLFGPVEAASLRSDRREPALRRLPRHRSDLSRDAGLEGDEISRPRCAGRGGASRAWQLCVDAHLLGHGAATTGANECGVGLQYRLRRMACSLRERGLAESPSSGRASLPPDAGSSTTDRGRSAR